MKAWYIAAAAAIFAIPAASMAQQTGANTGNNDLGLTHEQVMELQRAINDHAGCNAGPVDGIVGPRTERGIACIKREMNISGGTNEVLRALNLQFTSESTGEVNGAGETNATGQADTAGKNQTQSGVVNSKSGKSTLGPNIKHVRPTGIRGEEKGGKATGQPANQSKTGVVNTESGKSTLGPAGSHVRPTGIRGNVGDTTHQNTNVQGADSLRMQSSDSLQMRNADSTRLQGADSLRMQGADSMRMQGADSMRMMHGDSAHMMRGDSSHMLRDTTLVPGTDSLHRRGTDSTRSGQGADTTSHR